MKMNRQWLTDWVDIQAPFSELAERLTMVGLESTIVRDQTVGDFSGVVIGHVLSVESHPNADKLRICAVDVGADAPLSIVCGAPNVVAGMKVPTATIGAQLPNDIVIKKAKLRGVASQGMLCSAQELQFAAVSDGGIHAFPADAPVGMDVRTYLGVDEPILEVDLTPNRGDCASVRGVARELAVITEQAYHPPKVPPVDAVISDNFPVKIIADTACGRYVGRVIRGIRTDAVTPAWMKKRLEHGGIATIHPVVDVMNYVMLEWGQPMHAFDFAALSQHMAVRFAQEGESLCLLDGQEVALTTDTLVIADAEKPIAMAGAMGGLETAVTEGTQDVFLESAYFDRQHVASYARHYGLHTDSSYRFERGVDSALQVMAIERATQLLQDIVGGQAGPIILEEAQTGLPKEKTISLSEKKLDQLLGYTVDKARAQSILKGLGMPVEDVGQGNWQIRVPSWRFDMEYVQDVIEEVARVIGYDHIPEHVYRAPMYSVGAMHPQEAGKRRMRACLQDSGYHEIVTYSFVDPALQKMLDTEHTPIALTNPISADMSVMRTNLWPGLLQTFLHNFNRQERRIRLFEMGMRFRPAQESIQQENVLSGLVYGHVHPESWASPERSVDFFDVKADVEVILYLFGDGSRVAFKKETHPALHPGQSAGIYRGDCRLGQMGALHPSMLQTFGISGSLYLFELDMELLQNRATPHYMPISRFPAVRRDLAIVVDEGIDSDAIRKKIYQEAGNFLRDLILFDLYQGTGVPPGKKSVGLGLIFQEVTRTLSDEEVTEVVNRVVTSLGATFGAILRI